MAMHESRSVLRDDIPSELRHRHGTITTLEHQALRAAKEHSALILRGIRSELGHVFHLPRAQLAQNLLSELDKAQVVLVSGPAGCGKSSIAKDVVQLIADDQFVLGLRAEELAQAHLDITLLNAQIPTNARTLEAILAAQSKKLVLVESIERLLERPTRDALSDLMTLVRDDPGLRVLLTCRDYSTEQVRASFLESNKIKHTVISVPPLDDAELAQAEIALPALAIPMQNPALRRLLRNPFFLDKALEIKWSGNESLPKSEHEFRKLFWRQVIRADQRSAPGTARDREKVFQEIAIRRARALSPYVSCTDLDPATVATLRNDALLDSPHESLSLAATAHDVLEDWAIIHWIEEQNVVSEGSLKTLAECIGGYPAIRRAYRSWVSELIDNDPNAADKLLTPAIRDTETNIQFRDDTLISFLKASSASGFLTHHEAILVANELFLLKRIVHLLRVACMKMPSWLAGTTDTEVTVSVPDGPAWPLVLQLVDRNISRFTTQDRLPLLGFIEDASSDISWWAPNIAGTEHVASIAHWLLEEWSYGSKMLTRTLKVIAKVPKADGTRFEKLLRGPEPQLRWQDRDEISEELQELVFAGTDGGPAGRDMPGVVLSVASAYLLITSQDQVTDRYAGSMLNLERYFGIRDERAHEFFPPSALRGPWLALLRHHPDKGLAFILHLLNESIRFYVRTDWDMPLEPAWQIGLTFADGILHKQGGNARLWNLYRGLSVGPHVLQSILMALENWLLNYAKSYPQQIDAILCVWQVFSAHFGSLIWPTLSD
ncbi:MAG: NACHT domain-containing protein [Candidatus Acidiferrales bacterium]